MLAAKLVLSYLRETIDVQLTYCQSPSNKLESFADDSWKTDHEKNHRSRSKIQMIYGNAPIYAKSKFQEYGASSSMEAKYVSRTDVYNMIRCLRRILTELGTAQRGAVLYQSNSGAMD